MKKRYKLPDLICTCGHLEKDHSHKLWGLRASECRIVLRMPKVKCNCIRFMLDNLLYLEILERIYYGR